MVSFLSSRSNKKQFQLVDLAVERLWCLWLADQLKWNPEIQVSHIVCGELCEKIQMILSIK